MHDAGALSSACDGGGTAVADSAWPIEASEGEPRSRTFTRV